MPSHILSLGCLAACPKIAAATDRTNVAVTSSDILVFLDKIENIFILRLSCCLMKTEC